MNTYDFDKTIYPVDSSGEFFRFCLKRYPGAVCKVMPGIASSYVSYKMNRCTFLELKEQIFSFLKDIPDVDAAVNEFWCGRQHKIWDWYLKQKKDDDVIISASPEFLLRPICEILKVELIATVMDKHTGRISGLNCHDSEKVRRFYEMYPGCTPDEFYSDSLSDTPMADIARRAFRIKNGKVLPWK